MLNMSAESLIVLVVVGAVAGWLAGMVMSGKKKRGIIVNSIIGIIGAFVGGFVFKFFGFSVAHGIVGELFIAFIGAVIFLWLVSLLK